MRGSIALLDGARVSSRSNATRRGVVIQVSCRRDAKGPAAPLLRSGRSLSAVGVTGFEPAASSSRTTRATKLRHTPWQPPESTPNRTMVRIAGRHAVARSRPAAGRRTSPTSVPPAVRSAMPIAPPTRTDGVLAARRGEGRRRFGIGRGRRRVVGDADPRRLVRHTARAQVDQLARRIDRAAPASSRCPAARRRGETTTCSPGSDIVCGSLVHTSVSSVQDSSGVDPVDGSVHRRGDDESVRPGSVLPR